MKESYPYQNLDLADLPGEEWDDIPGFDGSYHISNYGRVKSLRREVQTNNGYGGSYMLEERILKPRLNKSMNITINELSYLLAISLCLDGCHSGFSIARLVYTVFVRPIDYEDRSILIRFKDGDSKNVYFKNLIESNSRELRIISFTNERARSHWSELSQPVTQFDQDGNPLRSFNSMYEIEKLTGLKARSISSVVSGTRHMYKGVFWKAGILKRKLDLKKIQRSVPNSRINTHLLKKLNLKNIDIQNPPAIVNLSLRSMPGEKWKDMPDYEGLYKVSNFGRIKALKKITVGKQQKWMPEQIQRIAISITTRVDGRKVPGSTYTVVWKDGIQKCGTIPRLVYFLFVKKFDRSNTDYRIYYKDGNSLNVHYKNLELRHSGYSFLAKK